MGTSPMGGETPSSIEHDSSSKGKDSGLPSAFLDTSLSSGQRPSNLVAASESPFATSLQDERTADRAVEHRSSPFPSQDSQNAACEHSQPSAAPTLQHTRWSCPSCTLENDATSTHCVICENPRPAAAPYEHGANVAVERRPSRSPSVGPQTAASDNPPPAATTTLQHGTWSCSTCTLKNDISATHCA